MMNAIIAPVYKADFSVMLSDDELDNRTYTHFIYIYARDTFTRYDNIV